MEEATLLLILLALRVGRLAVEQLELMDLDVLPPEKRAELIQERDELNVSLARLDTLER